MSISRHIGTSANSLYPRSRDRRLTREANELSGSSARPRRLRPRTVRHGSLLAQNTFSGSVFSATKESCPFDVESFDELR